ncbi:PAS/PAC sensor hybrid histidine kinase [Fischerella sp. NIES-4106]|nr:PAS/PAC sensor hybrid histidine kinase [Fischerella sp. NIES-4106]
MPDFEQFLPPLTDDKLSQQRQASKLSTTVMIANQEQAMLLQLVDGRIQACNPLSERILGLKAEQLIGRSWLDESWRTISEDGSPFTQDNHPFMVALTTGQPCLNVVMGLYQPYGELVWLLVNSQPLFLPGATIPYSIVTTFTEIITTSNLASVLDHNEVALATALKENPNLIQRIASSSLGTLYIYDLVDERVIYINNHVTQILGYTQQEIQTTGLRSLLQRMYPQDFTRLPTHYDRLNCVTDGEVVSFEFQYRHANDQWRWLRCYDTVLRRTTQGLAQRILGFCEDITEQRLKETALRQSHERFELAAAAVNCLIYDWDSTSNTVQRTQGLTELLGYTLEETEPTSAWWRSHIHPDDIQQVDQDFAGGLAKGDRFYTQYRVRHKDGHYLWVEDRGLAVRDHKHDIIRIVGATTNISDALRQVAARLRKQTEADLRESEERIRLATAAAELGMWFWDLTTNDLVWTAKCKQLFGLAANTEMSYEIFLDSLHPDDRQFTHQAVMQTLEAKVDYDVEYRVIWPNGSIHWIAAKGRCLYDYTGKAVRMMGTTQNITERKHTEEALRQSEERYRMLSEAMPEMIWTSNAAGVTDYTNQRWCDYSGLTLEETVGTGWQKLLHPDDLESTIQRWQESLQTGIPFENEQRYKRASDGTYRWHLVRAYPLRDNQGNIIKWFGTCTDIDDQKQIQQQRARLLELEQAARAEAETANRIKDQFLAILSHELRSPLNPILGWTKLLRSRKLDPTATDRALDTIERNAKLQIQLIDDLLDVSRILRGKLSLNLATVDLTTVINAALETVQSAAQTKKIQLEYISPPTSPICVQGDSNRLQQVVSNLLSNAVKFTPSGGRVEVRLSQVLGTGDWGSGNGDQESGIRNRGSGIGMVNKIQLSTPIPNAQCPIVNYAQIAVTDTGTGISSEFLPYVFEYFRQADSSTTRKFGGLGLGLAIVRHLVELHSGVVTADSPGEEQGATFTLKLPLIEQQAGVEETDTEKEVDKFSSSYLAGLRILVVDDDTDTRNFLEFLLKEYGAIVTVARSANQALTTLAQLQHDLLISDIGMPEVDGYGLIEQIRAIPPEQGGNILAIALTAYAGDSDRSRLLAAGFQAHIAKPVDIDQLLLAIADLCSPLG